MITRQQSESIQTSELRYLPELPDTIDRAELTRWWADVRSVLDRVHQSLLDAMPSKSTLLATVAGASGAEPARCTWSINAGRLVLSYQLGGETHYVYLPLDGSSSAWTHTTQL